MSQPPRLTGDDFAEPHEPINYQPFRQDHDLPDWKDTRRLLKRAAPRELGTARHEDNRSYYAADVMQKEWERLWPKVWLIAGHLNDIPKQNAFMRFDIGHESFLIVRGEGDSVRAMYNVCQHRGTELVTQDFGTAQKFVCPFHKWEYASDGTLLKIQDRETFRAGALCHDLNLKQVKVEVWRGWVFINMDRDAASLEEYLTPQYMANLAAYDFETAVRIRDVVQEWPANWKTAHEAFLEGYHVQATHPQLVPAVDAYHALHNMYGNGNALSIYQYMSPSPQYASRLEAGYLAEEHKIFLREAGIAEADFPKDWRDVPHAVIQAKRAKKGGLDYTKFSEGQLIDSWGFGIFPCTEGFLHPEGFFVQSWYPHPSDPEKCIYKVQVYAVPGVGELPSFMAVDNVDLSGEAVLPRTYVDTNDLEAVGPVISQDRTLVPRVQRRMRSRGFEGAVLGEQEIRIRDFYSEYYRYMR